MSHRQTPHSTQTRKHVLSRHRFERGYVMVTLLAGMTIALVVMAAAVPSIKHQVQREHEEEMFFRGAQIAQAIVKYRATHSNQFPTKLEDLTELFQVGGKRMRYLRSSALRDPMTPKGEWKAVRAGDPLILELYNAYLLTVKQPPPPNSLLSQLAGARGGTIVGGGLQTAGESLLSAAMQSNKLNNDTGPIVGVVSQSKDPVIRNYYGIETYDHSAFIDGTRMPGLLVNYPIGGGVGGTRPNATATPGPDGKCPPAVLCIDPNCPPDMQRAGKCVPFQTKK